MIMLLLRRASFWVALLGIVGTVLLVEKTQAQLNEPAPPPPITPPTKPFKTGIAASGLVEALNENTNIGVPVSGLVTQVFVKVWDKVKAGDPLFSLDDRDLQAQLLVERAEVGVGVATLERVRDQLGRLEGVTDPRAVSQDDLKTRRNDVAVAAAQLDAARAAVAETEALVGRLVVRAPIDATILQVNTRAGEFLSVGAPTSPMVLGNLDEMQLRADVDEQIAPRVKVGKNAIGFLKGDSTTPIPMEFVRIEPYVIPKVSLTGASDERVDTRVLQVIFKFPHNTPKSIYVGQQMDVYIQE